MRMEELRSGQFFEFRQAGYSFRRCLFLGEDSLGRLAFVHQSAGLSHFILNEFPSNHNPIVTVDVPQNFEEFPNLIDRI